jgi:hypothetical protein
MRFGEIRIELERPGRRGPCLSDRLGAIDRAEVACVV